jgi:hypothetical protein
MARVEGDWGRPVPSQAATEERGSYRDEEDEVGRDELEQKKLGGFLFFFGQIGGVSVNLIALFTSRGTLVTCFFFKNRTSNRFVI